ncbi:MAG: type II toxin-antitoxin system VapC family toxin [Anaerolineae bacterium]
MDLLFIDSSAWLSLELYRDQNHEAGRRFASGPARGYRWVTTNWVFSETVTLLRRHASHEAAVRIGTRLRDSSQILLVQVEVIHEQRAWHIFKDYADKDFGFVDCTSFAVMESLGVQEAFTFDKHFRQFGFQTLPVVS